ncbi:UPF0481 protein At3g47200-like [Momordica charantia]|uniref:UPF0481 protein At3g47200-like n=1 Tax=Momordica charantia TaxID=3673 RepID=A0A6J1BR71_MOMCH|nr:UPF0481 protein At3g47200-like [Momordica charantia]
MEDDHIETYDLNKKIDEVELEQPHVTISMKNMLEKLHPISEECSIYRVSKRLHNINDMAYTPQAISIGPFHHGQKEFMAMEQLKLRFLDAYLRRVGMGIEDAFEIAQGWETRARKCYAEHIDMKSDNFVKMMLVDGAFLVEFIRMHYQWATMTQPNLNYTLFQAIHVDIYRDLILLENQLPFFILECLLDKCSSSTPFVLFTSTFCRWYTGARELISDKLLTKKPNHLVDFLSFYYALPTVTGKNDKLKYNKRESPPTATELWEAGVEFQKATEDKRLIMDIRFKDGVLSIPHLEIHDAFETYVRNLLAYEHYHIGDDERCLIQYVYFLDELISTERDVSLLVKAGIITNNIGGNNEDVSKLFNDLCKDINISCDFYYYADISMDLHKYCETWWHRSMASLRRDYFNTPWAFISFLAATFLVLLTSMQAIYSAISYHKSKP